MASSHEIKDRRKDLHCQTATVLAASHSVTRQDRYSGDGAAILDQSFCEAHLALRHRLGALPS